MGREEGWEADTQQKIARRRARGSKPVISLSSLHSADSPVSFAATSQQSWAERAGLPWCWQEERNTLACQKPAAASFQWIFYWLYGANFVSLFTLTVSLPNKRIDWNGKDIWVSCLTLKTFWTIPRFPIPRLPIPILVSHWAAGHSCAFKLEFKWISDRITWTLNSIKRIVSWIKLIVKQIELNQTFLKSIFGCSSGSI